MSLGGRSSTFLGHDNMTVTLNEPGGTHQTAPMTERHGPAGQPGHHSHHVHGLPGPHGSWTGPTSRTSSAALSRLPKIIYGTEVCAGGLWWAAGSKLRLPSLPGGAPKKICQVSSLEVNVGAQAGQVTNFSMHAEAKVGHKIVVTFPKIGHFWERQGSASGFQIQGSGGGL